MADDQPEQAKGRSKKKLKRQRRARNQLHLYLHPSGIWYMRGTVGDKRVHESTKTHSKEHAEHIAAAKTKELMDEKVHGKIVTATFADAVAGYRASKGSAGDNSMTRYVDRLLVHFGKTKLKDIDEATVHAHALSTYPTNTNTSHNTIVIAPMRTILRHAARQKLCSSPEIAGFPDDGKKIEGHDDAFVTAFIDSCHCPELRALVALMTTTAVRCIEALRIEKSQIDRDAMEIRLRPEQTKTKKGRSLALTGQVLQYLDGIPESPRQRLFHWVRTGNVDSAINTTTALAGLDHTSAHRIGRHSFAERMLRLGHDCHTVCKMGGWESLHTFVVRYGHLEKKKVEADVRTAGADLLKPKLKIVGGN